MKGVNGSGIEDIWFEIDCLLRLGAVRGATDVEVDAVHGGHKSGSKPTNECDFLWPVVGLVTGERSTTVVLGDGIEFISWISFAMVLLLVLGKLPSGGDIVIE